MLEILVVITTRLSVSVVIVVLGVSRGVGGAIRVRFCF